MTEDNLMVKCKHPDKDCPDRYHKNHQGLQCRLYEWKKKLKICPYDESIKSHAKRKPGQKSLNVV